MGMMFTPQLYMFTISFIPNTHSLDNFQGKYAKFKKYVGHSAHVTNVRWTRNNKHLISIGGADTAVLVWSHVGMSDTRTNACGESDDSDTDDEEEGETNTISGLLMKVSYCLLLPERPVFWRTCEVLVVLRFSRYIFRIQKLIVGTIKCKYFGVPLCRIILLLIYVTRYCNYISLSGHI